jgi:hypothetical protein
MRLGNWRLKRKTTGNGKTHTHPHVHTWEYTVCLGIRENKDLLSREVNKPFTYSVFIDPN